MPPLGGGRAESWSPKNYEGGASGIVTLRKALENSRNLATVHLLEGGIAAKPEQSLDRLCALALELQIYRDFAKYYPFVLGAEPVRPIDLAAFYAAIANEGVRPSPHAVEAIEQDGVTYRREAPAPASVSAADRAAYYQLKTMLQGVVQRGTAHALAPLAPYVAGKTGTTEDQNDAWFVGFTNDITVAVWVGYDNAGEQRRTLGDGSTGAAVAAPIFESIVKAAWSQGMSKTVLAPPSAEAKRDLSCKLVEPETAERRRRGSAECLRLDAKGRPREARYRLSRATAPARMTAPAPATTLMRDATPTTQRTATGRHGTMATAIPSFGSLGRYGGGPRDPSSGWRQDDQPGWRAQRRGFWN